MSQYEVTDDGRRLADAHERARLEGGVGRWIAARLSDGGTAGEVFDRRDQAVRHHSTDHMYVQIQPGPMPPAEATALIAVHRRAREAGFDFTDPHQQPQAPMSGPLPTTAAARLAARGFVIPNRRDRRDNARLQRIQRYIGH